MKKFLLISTLCVISTTSAHGPDQELMKKQRSNYTFLLAVASSFLANTLPKSKLGQAFGNAAAIASACTTWYLLTGSIKVTTSPSAYRNVLIEGFMLGSLGALTFNKIVPYIWNFIAGN